MGEESVAKVSILKKSELITPEINLEDSSQAVFACLVSCGCRITYAQKETQIFEITHKFISKAQKYIFPKVHIMYC